MYQTTTTVLNDILIKLSLICSTVKNTEYLETLKTIQKRIAHKILYRIERRIRTLNNSPILYAVCFVIIHLIHVVVLVLYPHVSLILFSLSLTIMIGSYDI
jgi:hypothetical protein